MATRSTTSYFQPSPPITRIPTYGNVFAGTAQLVINPQGTTGTRTLNMSTAPATNGDRIAGLAPSYVGGTKGIVSRL